MFWGSRQSGKSIATANMIDDLNKTKDYYPTIIEMQQIEANKVIDDFEKNWLINNNWGLNEKS